MEAGEHERQSLGWHQRRPFAQLALHDAQLLVEGDDLTVGVHAGEVQGGGYAAGVLEDAPVEARLVGLLYPIAQLLGVGRAPQPRQPVEAFHRQVGGPAP